MRVLFTGASSFTGMWFVKELASQGYTITAAFQRPKGEYSGVRRERIDQIIEMIDPVFDCPFGSDLFLRLIGDNQWDLLCLHGAEVTNYKSPNFPVVTAVENNTKNLNEMMMLLHDSGCQRLILTGSVFEPREGAGSDNLKAVSPYGLSKGITSDLFRYYAEAHNMNLGKFVIPNPFGPFEEQRFTHYLMEQWQQGKVASIKAPAYVRDNIHVSLLAKAYANFVNTLRNTSGYQQFNPSGYAESQGSFTARFANEMRQRLPWSCQYLLEEQTEFTEPKVRINTEPVNCKSLKWNAKEAWDEIATYYEDYLTT